MPFLDDVNPPPPELFRFFPEELGGLTQLVDWARRRGTITSWYRSKLRNQQEGGVPNSQHMWGLAFDAVPDDKTELLTEARDRGCWALDQGNYVHVQFFQPGAWKRATDARGLDPREPPC